MDGGKIKDPSQKRTGKDEQIKVMGRNNHISLAPSCCSELWVAWEERVMESQLHLKFYTFIQKGHRAGTMKSE